MSPKLLSTIQICFFLFFALSVTLTFFSSLFALSFIFISVLRCLQIYYQPINSVFSTFCTEFNLKFFFFLLFSLGLTFLNVLQCLQIYYQLIIFVFFFTFCIECNSYFLFFTFCIDFHFYHCFAMSPKLLSTIQICFIFYFLH